MSQNTGDGPYHYGSHYSNSGIVLHFLVRLPPFTQLFLRYQGNRSEKGERTAFSHVKEQCFSLSVFLLFLYFFFFFHLNSFLYSFFTPTLFVPLLLFLTFICPFFFFLPFSLFLSLILLVSWMNFPLLYH